MSRTLSSLVFVVIACMAAPPADAQTSRPGRPYRGLFGGAGGTNPDTSTGTAAQLEKSLTAMASLGGGYDDNLLAQASGNNRGTVNAAGAPPSGQLVQGSVGLNYVYQSDELSLNASGGTMGSYYPSLDDRFVRAAQGHLSVGKKLSTKTHVNASGTAAYQPFTLQLFLPDVQGDVRESDSLDSFVTPESRMTYLANANLAHQLGRRTTLTALANYRTTERGESSGRLAHRGVGAQLSHNLARDLGVHAGYIYSEARLTDGRTIPNHILRVGIDYNRPLSLSRRTTLAFRTGSSVVETHDAMRLHAIGDVSLNHEIGRTWEATAMYSRRIVYYETWDEPTLANIARASLGGLFSRRVQFTAGMAYTSAGVGARSGAPRYETFQSGAALNFAISRFMSSGVTYAYYRHRAREAVPLPEDFPRQLDRQSIQAFLNVWVPLMQKIK